MSRTGLQYEIYHATENQLEEAIDEQEGIVVVFKRGNTEESYREELARLLRGCSRIGLQAFEWESFSNMSLSSYGEGRLLGPPPSVTGVIPEEELMQVMVECAKDVRYSGSSERNLAITAMLAHGVFTMLALGFIREGTLLLLWLLLDPLILWFGSLVALEIYNWKKYNKPFKISLRGPARRYRNRIEARLYELNERYPKLLFEHHWNWIQLSHGHMELVSVRARESLPHNELSAGINEDGLETATSFSMEQNSLLDHV
mmetsp:Transcript_19984/g.39255  ORF Transcript_19984/g.39255 Transcript_19984/m.39255 type:complete len:259 (-) Transcript_19984:49-825(-)|eukprot:CAMPEP_0171530590 /NCGR_PEP_ID=MMETSP0959-20130129/13202_1 /TAXON_ID=87120 /ORGANISM="Aurantiochytrium limacinum, Strain ATCCMYA-1381" /LENGTH=258 /DNA_ID=CAMNT_0012073479 /DNA_START=275 /DNA_END=1051 /DNA_ORIENTATION=-